MKKGSVYFLLSFVLSYSSSSFAQYLGGDADGYASVVLTASNCATPINQNIYFGGIDDGSARSVFTGSVCPPPTNENIYFGGIDDGHASSVFTGSVCPPPTNENIYFGGIDDGHARSVFTGSVCPPPTNENIYFGGIDDGHARSVFTGSVCPPPPNANIYFGGTDDGHARSVFTGSVCPPPPNANIYFGGVADGADYKVFSQIVCSPLPIELILFEAKCNANKTVSLTWSTATETNNDFFTLERTSDAINFEAIGKIGGAGNSNQLKKYSFTDTTSKSGYLYYRLKQTDYNGDYQYSDIVATDCNEKNSAISIYPNPNSGEFVINGFGKEGFLVVYNVLGEIVEAKKIENNRVKINLKDQKSGFYFVNIESENKKFTNEKIIVNK